MTTSPTLAEIAGHAGMGIATGGRVLSHRPGGSTDTLRCVRQAVPNCLPWPPRVLRGLCENVRGALGVVQPRTQISTAENLP